ncbi:MAG: PepSY-associated TM helix domain-containing protein [Pseudomonadota bacterium]
MSFVAKAPTQRLLAVHGWSGTILGLFLYLIVVTGAVAVFAGELRTWSQPGQDRQPLFDRPLDLDRPLDPTLAKLSENMPEAYKEEIQISGRTDGQLQIVFHGHAETEQGETEDTRVRYVLDSDTHEVLSREQGFRSEMPAPPRSALVDFIVTLHVNLHAPDPWGLYMTGILGFVMVIATVSGLILHRHIITDLFVSPRLSSRLLNSRDRHILAGTWSLPFGFILAFTGAFFSFAVTIGVPVIAFAAFGGDTDRLVEVLQPIEIVADSPGQTASIDGIIADSSARAGIAPSSIRLADYNAEAFSVRVNHLPREGGINGVSNLYDGSTGKFISIVPFVGTTPSVGSSFASLMGPLHFGNFGGLISKLVWGALGAALAYVTLSGLQLWVRRRAERPAWAWMNNTVILTGYGVPITMLGAAFGYFPALGLSADASYWTAFGFLGSAAALVVLGVLVRKAARLTRILQWTMIVALAITPCLRLSFGGHSWFELMQRQDVISLAIDLIFWIGAVWGVLSMLKLKLSPNKTKETLSVPAE